MGAGVQRWWRDGTALAREQARWILEAEPQLHFREFAMPAYKAFVWACRDNSLFPSPPKPFAINLSKTCRGCGRRDGTHEHDCPAVAAEEKLLLQRACDHLQCGIMRTTGDPPGPWCCARCGVELPDELLITYEAIIAPDLVSSSGRETMSVTDRIELIQAELFLAPFNGVSEATRSVSQAIHDLKLTVGWMRSTIETVASAKARGQTDETLAKGANMFISWIECLVLAWKRGGHNEWSRVLREQRERRKRGEMA